MNSPERLIALVNAIAKRDNEAACIEFKVNNFGPDRIGTLISGISNSARLDDKSCGYPALSSRHARRVLSSACKRAESPAFRLVLVRPNNNIKDLGIENKCRALSIFV